MRQHSIGLMIVLLLSTITVYPSIQIKNETEYQAKFLAVGFKNSRQCSVSSMQSDPIAPGKSERLMVQNGCSLNYVRAVMEIRVNGKKQEKEVDKFINGLPETIVIKSSEENPTDFYLETR